MGGGRQVNLRKFIYATGNKHCSWLKRDNLKHVTLLKCVDAKGCKLKPFFVLSEGLPIHVDKAKEIISGYTSCHLLSSYH